MRNESRLPLDRALKEGWQKVRGVKGAFWGAALIIILIGSGAFGILGTTFFAIGKAVVPHFQALTHKDYFNSILRYGFSAAPIKLLLLCLGYYIIQGMLEMFILLPMRMGAQLIPLRRSLDKSVSATFIFKFFTWDYIWRFVMLEMYIALMVGIPGVLSFLFFCLPHAHQFTPMVTLICKLIGVLFIFLTFYFIVGYLFAVALIIDRNMTPWAAMELSRKSINPYWFFMASTIIWLTLVLMAGILCLGIGLIWAGPYAFNVMGILYRDLLGIEGRDPVTLLETTVNRIP